MRKGYEGPTDYLKPLSREEEYDLAERMFWKKLQLFDMTAGSLECVNAVYDEAVKERERRGVRNITLLESPQKYEFTTKPRLKKEDKKPSFNLSTLFCLLETARECTTTANKNALRDYFMLHPGTIDLFAGVRRTEIGELCDQYLRLHAKLVEHNRLFVKNIAKKPVRGVDYYERIETGELGLMTAAHKFNFYEGWRFCTYAIWWIKRAITRTSQESKIVRIPLCIQTPGAELPKETSLNYSTKEDEGLLNCLENRRAENPFEETARSVLENDMARLLTRISEREADILKMRFGIGGNDPMTLEEVGKKLKVSRERIRQIEAIALQKIAARGKRLALAV